MLVPKFQALGLLGNYLIYGSTKYLWVLRKNLLHVTLQASRILRWLQDIWKFVILCIKLMMHMQSLKNSEQHFLNYNNLTCIMEYV